MVMLYTNYFIDTLREFSSDKDLIDDRGQSITANALFNSSLALAQCLLKKGVKRGDRVILAVKPGVEFLQISYANMMIRTVVSIIDPEMGRDNYKAKLTQFKPQHAFVDSRLVLLSEHPLARYIIQKIKKSIPDVPILRDCQVFTTGPWLPIVQRHTNLRRLRRPSTSEELLIANDNEDFLVTYTSGTLAEPKGVVHSYGSLSNSIRYLAEMLKENNDQVIATHLPPFVLLGISAGVKVFLWDNTASAKTRLAFIQQNGITSLFGPPSDYLSLIQYLNARGLEFPACLKSIYLGSAPVYNSFLVKLLKCCNQVNVISLYGMTENLMVTYQDARQKILEQVDGDLVGKPFRNVKIAIDDDGEIAIQSDQLFTRYWHHTKVESPHRTGDLGKLDEQGRLILQGRKKDMIIRRNFNVYPGLYEPTINKIDGITEAVMIGRYKKEKADEEIVLVVESEEQMEAASIQAKLHTGQHSIDREALPDSIVFMTLPRSGRQNKVNRQVLRKQIEELAS
jgi:acyl-CoA synthetase (AMP-forming)/AMP-acid ligase II